jgi:hypothetical protein
VDELRKVKFPRSITPSEGLFQKPSLMVFGDESHAACCLLVYLRWEREDGHTDCRLVTWKTKVAPQVKITIPMIELVAAVNSVG